MPAVLNLLEQLFMIKMNMGPSPLLDIIGGFSFYAVSSAVKLNIFESLGKESLSVKELAQDIECSERGTKILMDLLEMLGYVKRKGDRYHNTAMTAKWMLSESPISIKPAFQYYDATMKDLWPFLRESIIHGRPYFHFYDWLAEHAQLARSYQEFMMNLAKMIIPELRKKIGLGKGEIKALDIGGGHGLYSIALCKKYPNLSVTIFDSPYSRTLAEENIDGAEMSDRVNFIEGDYFGDDIDAGYDAVLLFNVLHEHTAEDNAKLVEKAVGALKVKGRLFVIDELREKKLMNIQNYFLSTYGLMFFHFLGGQIYSFEEICKWFESSGLKKIEKTNLYRSGVSLITGTLD